MGSESSSGKKPNKYLETNNSEKKKDLGLKIHICGDNSMMKDMKDNLFYEHISDKQYNKKKSRQFKTEQFYWIAKFYEEFTENTINAIMLDIIADRDTNTPIIKKQIILCFISEENQNLLSIFKTIKNDIYAPLIIIVSKKQIDSMGDIDRRITNIINKNTLKKETIISALWDCDCYFNERGNEICSYIQKNFFKQLDINLPFRTVNILLTGKSRSGKSTFVNFISRKKIALESDDRISVTQTLTEYYIYSSKYDDKFEHSSIKLVDTPGIVQNNIEKSKKLLEKIIFFPNKEKQIHFILFFFMEGDSLEGLDDIFKQLNNYNIPVLFIINKAFDDSDEGKTKDITSTISLLSQLDCKNLINKDNFIGINLVKNRGTSCFGVEEIFKRLHDIYKEKNKFSAKLQNMIKECRNNYYSELLKNTKKKSEKISDELLKKINEMKKELDNEIDMFKCLDIENIVNNGLNYANRYKNKINSLTNLSEKVNNFEYNNIHAISFLQAFMVKEIGEFFGYDTKEMNFNIKLYI